MGRNENISVFLDTEKMCKTNQRLKESVQNSIKLQKLILETDDVKCSELKRYDEPAHVIVSKKRTFEAAKSYVDQKVAVHNFASASNPGGCVVNGANAQEECLCRCSGLYFCLNVADMWKGFYYPHRSAHNPIHNDDIIYTPNVLVFKTDTAAPKIMNESEWYNIDVITCAAPNLREKPSNMFNNGEGNQQVRLTDKELLLIHEKRLKRILDVAVVEGEEVIILGAFGCGAFCNSPNVVAMAAKNVINDYLKAFKVIEFAIFCNPKEDTNYKTFERVLKPLLK